MENLCSEYLQSAFIDHIHALFVDCSITAMFATLRYNKAGSNQDSMSIERTSHPGLSGHGQGQQHVACTTCRVKKVRWETSSANRSEADWAVKAKCTGQKPVCDRCKSKGISCIFVEPMQAGHSRCRKSSEKRNSADVFSSSSAPRAVQTPIASPQTRYSGSQTWEAKEKEAANQRDIEQQDAMVAGCRSQTNDSDLMSDNSSDLCGPGPKSFGIVRRGEGPGMGVQLETQTVEVDEFGFVPSDISPHLSSHENLYSSYDSTFSGGESRAVDFFDFDRDGAAGFRMFLSLYLSDTNGACR